MIIPKPLVGIFGLRLVAAAYVKLSRSSFWVMEPAGFVTKDVSILAVRPLSLTGIMPANTYGIAAKYFLVKVQKRLKDGLVKVWIYFGMAGRRNYWIL